MLTFLVGSKQAFEISLADVAQSQLQGKNDVYMEFYVDDTAGANEISEILKDRTSWFRDCRFVDVINVLPAGGNGTIELLYMQLYAPTMLALARDFWLLRYISVLDDGSRLISEILKDRTSWFRDCRSDVINELPAGGNGTIELLYMQLYAPTMLALAQDFWLLRYISVLDDGSLLISEILKDRTSWFRDCQSVDVINELPARGNGTIELLYMQGRRPAALRALSQRLSRGFNEGVNGFADKGWPLINNDGVDDVSILVNSSPSKMMSLNLGFLNGFPSTVTSVMRVPRHPCFYRMHLLRCFRSFYEGIDQNGQTAVQTCILLHLPKAILALCMGPIYLVLVVRLYFH